MYVALIKNLIYILNQKIHGDTYKVIMFYQRHIQKVMTLILEQQFYSFSYILWSILLTVWQWESAVAILWLVQELEYLLRFLVERGLLLDYHLNEVLRWETWVSEGTSKHLLIIERNRCLAVLKPNNYELSDLYCYIYMHVHCMLSHVTYIC